MTDDRIAGTARQGFGKAESAFGSVFGDRGTQARGKLNEAQGAVQDIYGRAVDHAQKTVEQVDALISERTYAALGAAAAAGLIVGLLLGRGGTRVVYVRK